MENKSVRIISYQNAKNYGAVLQAYGLQQTIKKLGYDDVKFINYNPQYLKDRYKVFSKNNFLTKLSGLPLVKFYIELPFKIYHILKRNIKIEKSVSRMLIQTSSTFNIFSQISDPLCNIIVCGSDQIWNTAITHIPDKAFFAYGNYPNLRKKVSYAASTEVSKLNDDNIPIICDYLNNLDTISVREASVKEKLSNYTTKEISVCVDPTLLCGSESYSVIASKRLVAHKYILIYAYSPTAKFINDIVKTIPAYNSYEIHAVLFNPSIRKQKWGNIQVHGELSVEEFLAMFKYADYVVTNSFHGLAFSLLFHKTFYVAYEHGKDGRCKSLLEKIGMQQRLIKSCESIDWSNIDYAEIDRHIRTLRDDSIDYLKRALAL